MEDGSNPPASVSIKIVQTFERDAVKYYFYTKPCSCCNNPLYFIGRTDGARSQITEEKIDNVELLVDELHQSFAVDITTILEALKDTISDITASDGWGRFQTDGLSNYRIKTLDRARLILKRFDGEGKLAHLEANADNIDDNLVSAFMLGYLASENWWIINHEDAVFEGYRQLDARDVGRPLAVAARLRIGRRSRQAVINAAREIYHKEPKLRRK